MPALQFRILGDFHLTYDQQPITTLTAQRLRALLAYLALHHAAPQQRHHLAFLFWPDTSDAQARNNLRQLLHQLRKAFPDAEQVLAVDAHQVQWHPSLPWEVDAIAFTEALARADRAEKRQDHSAHLQALIQADALYGGDLLPDCYDDWIIPERQHLHQHHLRVLERLVVLLQEAGDYGRAIPHAQRLCALTPLSEANVRQLMRLYVLNNDRASALHAYHTCVTLLQRELGVEPEPATQAAYADLMHAESSMQTPIVHQLLPAAPVMLIGRQREWQQFHQLWHSMRSEGMRFLLLSGDAGVGKSRLADAFLAWAAQQGATIARSRCHAAEGQLSLAPVTDLLRSEELRDPLAQLPPIWRAEIARLLPELIAQQPSLLAQHTATEYGQRQRFFEALTRAVLGAPQPLVLFIDDLHWCDQETCEWLHFLLRYQPMARLLVVGCVRDDALSSHHPFQQLLLHLPAVLPVTTMPLALLDAAETMKLASQVAKRELTTAETLRLFHETGGNPLFVVEMMRATMGHLTPQPADAIGQLPPRVHAMLSGRLQQLSPATRECVDLAAVIGHDFTPDLLSTLGDTDDASAVRALDELWHKRIVHEHGLNRYDFTHDKLREVAYAEISAPQRRMLHRRVAQTLERLHADDLEAYSGQIASHFERAGLPEQALPHYQRAAAMAQRLYANDDAIALLRQGLSILSTLPTTTRRDQQELTFLLALAPLYRITRGWSAPELEDILDRALALCDVAGDNAQRAQILYGWQSFYVVQAKLEKVQAVAHELHALYRRSLGIAPPLFSGTMLVGTWLHLGQFTKANEGFIEMLAVNDPEQLTRHQESQGTNYLAHSRAWHAHALWCLGHARQAHNQAQAAENLVQQLDQPFNQALVGAYNALLYQVATDAATAHATAERAYRLADTYQAPYYRAWAAILLRYAEAQDTTTMHTVAQLRAAIEHFTTLGAKLRLPYYLALLAQMCADAGLLDEGLQTIATAMHVAHATKERWWDAELHRTRAHLLCLHGADRVEVQTALSRAITIAQSQSAKALQLRAMTDLAELGGKQHTDDENQQQLHALIAWFADDPETPDLHRARFVLAQR